MAMTDLENTTLPETELEAEVNLQLEILATLPTTRNLESPLESIFNSP
jgi:hypothetical protein